MNLQEIIDKETARGNYRGQVQIDYSSHFRGVIENYDAPRIKLIINSNYNPERFKGVVRALLRHEINHHGYAEIPGCPGKFSMHISLLEEVSRVLSQAGYPNVRVTNDHTLYTYMTNMFADFVDNSQLGRRRNHFGMWNMYKEDLSHTKISPLFDAFIRLQEYSYGTKYSKSLLRPHHTDDPKVTVSVRGFISEANISRTVPKDGKKLLDEVLFTPKEWPKLARIFTEKLLPLIDKDQLISKKYIKAVFLPLESGFFPSELENPNVQMDIAFNAYKKGSVFEPPTFLEPQLSLLRLYQRLAQNLEIKVGSATTSVSMPVCYFGKREFDPRTNDLSKIILDFNGQLRLRIRPHSVEMPFDVYDSITKFPNIQLAFLDTSDSTRDNLGSKPNPKIMNPWSPEKLQWSDDSKYHYELLALFGFWEFLRKQGILNTNSVRLLNFSSSQIYAPSINDSMKLALSPQFRNTVLTDVPVLFGASHPKKLIFTLTDGDVFNWNSIKDDFINRAKEQYYFHFQIGDSTTMSLDLEAAHLPVFYDDGLNLGKLIIDLTKPFVAGRKK